MSNYVSRVMAVQPIHFAPNPEAMDDNFFTLDAEDMPSEQEITDRAQKEWQNFINKLEEYGIEVKVFRNTRTDVPDEVFPDWCTTLKDVNFPEGVLIIYPMKCATRRRERDPHIIQGLKKLYPIIIDLSYFESQNMYLEGKGTLAWDKRGRNIFMSESQRAFSEVATELVRRLNEYAEKPWKLHIFNAYNEFKQIIYHTDLVLNITPNEAIFCREAVPSQVQVAEIESALFENGYYVIDVSLEQINKMACNFQYLWSPKVNGPVIFMSAQAQEFGFELSAPIEYLDVRTLETVGGGSIHCMLVELW